MMTTSPFRSPRSLALVAAAALIATACGGRALSPAPPAPAPTAELAEPELTRLLDAELLTPEREARVRDMDAAANPLPPRLARLSADSAAPAFARGNALLMLGELRAVGALPAFSMALRSGDVNVRAAAATGLEGFLGIAPAEATRLLRVALRDEDPWVQARALQSLGPREPGILRAYIPLAPDDDLRAIARSLLQLAEERGAPLSEEMAAGVAVPDRLVRETSGGRTLIFRTERAWQSWGAAEGRLLLVGPGGDTVRVADGVEAVAGVVPAFFSPDERWLVYEAGREIRVLDTRSGADRAVAAGMAPRPLPFSERFLYLRPMDTAAGQGGETSMEFAVLAAPFAGGEAERLGALRARLSLQRFGNYAPVRWMRVEQEGERFFLAGEGIERFPLPDPFGLGAER
ncbi:MAG TPA: HEAT repeat domain-containing protein [Longimicrobiales bacterium]|nr:HEAT repeat domain-containing protein [Longimicrobiales bacterium]